MLQRLSIVFANNRSHVTMTWFITMVLHYGTFVHEQSNLDDATLIRTIVEHYGTWTVTWYRDFNDIYTTKLPGFNCWNSFTQIFVVYTVESSSLFFLLFIS